MPVGRSLDNSYIATQARLKSVVSLDDDVNVRKVGAVVP